jgi:hypothetical protein
MPLLKSDTATCDGCQRDRRHIRDGLCPLCRADAAIAAMRAPSSNGYLSPAWTELYQGILRWRETAGAEPVTMATRGSAPDSTPERNPAVTGSAAPVSTGDYSNKATRPA